MKITYDQKVDAVYIKFKKGKYSHTKKLSDDILVDISDKNKVLELEILDATNNIEALSPEKLTVELSRFQIHRTP